MDAGIEELLDIYESHSASFEDSAAITHCFCMTRHILQTTRERPPTRFLGPTSFGPRTSRTRPRVVEDPEGSSITAVRETSNPLPSFSPMAPQQSGGRCRVIPVIDVMNGQVVRALGGRRELYQPLRSKLTDSTEPAAVADALTRTLGVNDLYVADIDGLLGHRPRLSWIAALTTRGSRVMVDAGIRHASDAKAIFDAGASAVVAGTETIAGADELQALVQAVGPDRVVLSVDLRNGTVLGSE